MSRHVKTPYEIETFITSAFWILEETKLHNGVTMCCTSQANVDPRRIEDT